MNSYPYIEVRALPGGAWIDRRHMREEKLLARFDDLKASERDNAYGVDGIRICGPLGQLWASWTRPMYSATVTVAESYNGHDPT